MKPKLKAVIGGKKNIVDGYSDTRRLYKLSDGRRVSYDDVEEVLCGTGMREFDYHKTGKAAEIFERDRVGFLDKAYRKCWGVVKYSLKHGAWIIEVDKNIYGWETILLFEGGCPEIISDGG